MRVSLLIYSAIFAICYAGTISLFTVDCDFIRVEGDHDGVNQFDYINPKLQYMPYRYLKCRDGKDVLFNDKRYSHLKCLSEHRKGYWANEDRKKLTGDIFNLDFECVSPLPACEGVKLEGFDNTTMKYESETVKCNNSTDILNVTPRGKSSSFSFELKCLSDKSKYDKLGWTTNGNYGLLGGIGINVQCVSMSFECNAFTVKAMSDRCPSALWLASTGDVKREYVGDVDCSSKETGKWNIDDDSTVDNITCLSYVDTCDAFKLNTTCDPAWTNCSEIIPSQTNPNFCPEGKHLYYKDKIDANFKGAEEHTLYVHCDLTKGWIVKGRETEIDKIGKGGFVICSSKNPRPFTATTMKPDENITFTMKPDENITQQIPGKDTDSKVQTIIIISISVAGVVILLIILVFIYIVFKKRRHAENTNHSMSKISDGKERNTDTEKQKESHKQVGSGRKTSSPRFKTRR